MIYGYIRVSSDKQTVENQRFEISRFCDSNGLTIDGWIEETISGTRNYDKRKLGELLRKKARSLILCLPGGPLDLLPVRMRNVPKPVFRAELPEDHSF